MDRFQEMQVFIRIAERSSFTQAADDLQMPRATVTNLLKRMEERLGTRLLERTARTVRLTHDGEAFYRRCVHLVADMEEAEGSFRNGSPQRSRGPTPESHNCSERSGDVVLTVSFREEKLQGRE